MSYAEKIRSIKTLAGSTRTNRGGNVYLDDDTAQGYANRFTNIPMGEFDQACSHFTDNGVFPSIAEMVKYFGSESGPQKNFLSGESYELKNLYRSFKNWEVVWWKDYSDIWWRGQIQESNFAGGEWAFQVWGLFMSGKATYGQPLLDILRSGLKNISRSDPELFKGRVGNNDCELIGQRMERETEKAIAENLAAKILGSAVGEVRQPVKEMIEF